jgi:hypothetical protein
VFQDFERTPSGEEPKLGLSWNAEVRLAGEGEPVHTGSRSFRMRAGENWGGALIFGGSPPRSPRPHDNDRLRFWVYCLPEAPPESRRNNVGVKWFDDDRYASEGFSTWTVHTAPPERWTPLEVLYSRLPPDFHLERISRIEIVHYWPGTYYLDDVQFVRADRVYQSFEKERHARADSMEWGWVWNDGDTGRLSEPDEPVFEGRRSWKVETRGEWGGTGIQSERAAFVPGEKESFWHVDLNPETNDRLVFHVHALPADGKDAPVLVQFYDHDGHAEDGTKVAVWTRDKARAGRWTRLDVPFETLPSSLHLENLNKIQFQFPRPGTYYLDWIAATGPIPEFRSESLGGGYLVWDPVSSGGSEGRFDWYRLERRLGGAGDRFETVYRGGKNRAEADGAGVYRVRYEKLYGFGEEIPYASPWSEPVRFGDSGGEVSGAAPGFQRSRK